MEAPVPGSLLLDVREPGEYSSGVAEGAMLLPMDLVPHHLERLPRDRPITVYCAAGARSFGVAHWLREQGFAQAVSLAPGVGAFGRRLQPPPGSPGARVAVPAGRYEGVDLAACEGEAIARESGVLRVRVRDSQGFWVELQLPG